MITVVVVFAVVMVGLWLLRPTAPKHHINVESYERISVGMSESDVVAILGVKYGQHFSGTAHVTIPMGPLNSTRMVYGDRIGEDILCETLVFRGSRYQRKGWVGEDLSIWVILDEAGFVRKKLYYPVYLD
jgi:hypothetical protein